MRNKKVGYLIWGVVVGCHWIAGLYWDDSYLTPFSTNPIHLSSSSVESYKRIKDGRKETRIPFNSNFLFSITTILWWKHFTVPVEIVASAEQGVEIYQIHFRWVMSFKFMVCLVGVSSEVRLAEAAVKRTHNQPQSPGLREHVC